MIINQCSEAAGFLPSLSYDALLGVLSLLSVQDLGRLAQVSKEAKELAHDGVVWRRMCRELEEEWCKLFSFQASSYSSAFPSSSSPSSAVKPSLPLSVTIKPSHSRDWKATYHHERARVNITMKLIGLWNEKWCDVDVEHSTLIESNGTSFTVSYMKNKFTASFREFDAHTQTLVFHLEGGDSGWSFLYHLSPLPDGSLSLKVLRLHDKQTFQGSFIR